ncbi:MAG: hypothetical protein KQI81_23730 [Deltaproteobacteria bacterium]|nr:hypothetical protein [Deltaproteobacteria bacterium]
MMTRFFKLPVLFLVIHALLVAACSPLAPHRAVPPSLQTTQLTDAEQIAGETLAYLMEVVLGQAGDPAERAAWATRGLNLPLDFDLVSRRMFGPVPLRAELMVLDTNILGLSEVLYHYDRRLNLFKGKREHDSLYPCVELMATRLFLVHKLNHGEKVGLSAMIRCKGLFAPGSRDAHEAELAAMNLTETEFSFLKAVFQSEPAFLRYMEHPFLVSTLRRIGAAEQDAFTLSADQSANYRRWACPARKPLQQSLVTIAILPSMNPMFEASPGPAGAVTPSREYQVILDHLKKAILEGLARKRLDSGQTDSTVRLPVFFTPERPMAIHPGNAGRVIEDICPKADFTLILLGKNVYRAIYIDPENDIYPHEKRIYLDVDDIRYQQIDDEIDTIVNAVLPALTAAASDPVPESRLHRLKPSPVL